MADTSEGKSAAELQREIEMQRHRVEDTIDQIQEKLSPGQLVDELLTYSKSGSSELASTITRSAIQNPIPVALMAAAVYWMIAKPGSHHSSQPKSDRDWDQRLRANGRNRSSSYRAAGSGTYAGSGYSSSPEDLYADDPDYETYEDDTQYGTASVQGNALQRLGHVTDEAGRRYAEFVDDAGKKFRALTDEAGNRAGHFADEAGTYYRGFTDASGNRIEQFRDEAGNLLSDATGWASHTWALAGRRLRDARHAVSSGVRAVRSAAGAVAHGAAGVAHGAAGVAQGAAGLAQSAAGTAAELSARAGEVGGRVSRSASAIGGRFGGIGGDVSGRAGDFGTQFSNRAAGLGGQLSSRATQVTGQVQQQADDMMRSVQSVLQEQPLVGAAVAFAIGAALGSALPRLPQEDELMGEAADKLKGEAAQRAAELYEQGKEQVGALYETAQGKVSDIVDQAKEGLDYAREGLDHARQGVVSSLSTTSGQSGSGTSDETTTADDEEDAEVTSSADYGTSTSTTRTAY